MTFYTKKFDIINLKLSRALLFFTLAFANCLVMPAYAADFEPLDETALMSLSEHSKAMQQLAPQLRIQLRSVRMSMKFDVREIHNIERSIGKAQNDVERLIAMHNANRVNLIRARFLVDDLRRTARFATWTSRSPRK